MSFGILTTILGFFVLIFFLLLRLLKENVKIFVKKTNYYLLGGMLCFGLFGLTGFLLRPPQPVEAGTLSMLFQLWCIGLGALHSRIIFKILPWTDRNISWREWIFTLLIMSIGALAFFQVCVQFDQSKRVLEHSFADNLIPDILLFIAPLVFIKAYNLWMAIPSITVSGWTLPLDATPRPIEPGKSVKLTFLIPAKYGSGEIIQIDMLAPSERTLGETFHYILYRHNVEKNSYKKIEVAENNSRSKLYSWLFYVKARQWWWISKRYLNPDLKIRQFEFSHGEVIYVERLKNW